LRKLRRNGGWMELASIRRTIRKSLEFERDKKRKIDRHVCKAVENSVGMKNWSTCAQSCWENCWKEKLINMCEKLLWNLLKRKIDQHACKESYWESCWHRPDHVWWVAIYLYHDRTCYRSVHDVPIPSQNLLPDCAQCIDSDVELPARMCAMYLFTVSTGCIMHRVHTSCRYLTYKLFSLSWHSLKAIVYYYHFVPMVLVKAFNKTTLILI
jgi:hypothetical protein